MIGFAENRLLLWSLVALVLYLAAGRFLPDPYLSSSMSLLLLIFGGVTLIRYAPTSWDIIVRRKRNTQAYEGDGSHLAAYGVTLLSAGSCYVGLFGLLWVYNGQPGSWLGTAYSGFGRGIMAAGFALLFFSPDVTKRGFHVPARAWLFAIVAAVMIIIFALGVRVGQRETRLGSWEITQCRISGICPSAKADAERLHRLAMRGSASY